MLALLIVVLALAFAGFVVSQIGATRPGAGPQMSAPPGDKPVCDDLATTDPVAALLKHGTADDAARLQEQGIDLGALGYRPPGD